MRLCALAVGCLTSAWLAAAQDSGAGRTLFESGCAPCHGADGNDGEFASAITSRLSMRDDGELAALIRAGIPNRGMPALAFPDGDMRLLLAHLRTCGLREQAAARRCV